MDSQQVRTAAFACAARLAPDDPAQRQVIALAFVTGYAEAQAAQLAQLKADLATALVEQSVQHERESLRIALDSRR